MSEHRWHRSAISPWIRWPVVVGAMVTYVIPGLFSSYRAWVQVKSLDLTVPKTELRVGDTIRVQAVSWARTRVHLRLLLVQGGRADTLAMHVIPDNHNPSIDPRWRRDSIAVAVTPEVLAGYDRGPATIRAVAIGGPQWLRTPPPLIREKQVRLEPGNTAPLLAAPRSL